eukprot:gb/GECH01004252.1/.p1 GENE.gb/GECH01004252.1/~~gb/GECH01004252.1/.p1  ORF type:complete len:836 (+),score=186.72 gb/GECH01004252.1/:1-2508(+)
MCNIFYFCKPTTNRKYKRLTRGVYPKRRETTIDQQNITKLTLYAATNEDKIPKIGGKLEKYIRNDLSRRNYFKVEVGMAALGALIASCHDSLSLFMQNVIGVCYVLLESSNSTVRLRVLASELLNRLINYTSEIDNSSFESITKQLHQVSRSRVDNNEDTYKVRVASLRTLSKLLNGSNEHVDKMIPSILDNIKNHIPSDVTPENALNTRTTSTSGATAQTPTSGLITNSALAEANVTAEDVYSTALECLGSLARNTSPASISNVTSPMLKYFTELKWRPDIFPMICFRKVTVSLKAKQTSFIISCLVQHYQDISCKISTEPENKPEIQSMLLSLVNVIGHLTTIYRAVTGPKAMEVLGQMIVYVKNLLQDPDISDQQSNAYKLLKAFETAIGRIARRGQNSPQNLDIMRRILRAIKENRRQSQQVSGLGNESSAPNEMDERSHRNLLHLILVVSAFPAEHPSKNFPEDIIKALFFELLTYDPEARCIAMQVVESLCSRNRRQEIADHFVPSMGDNGPDADEQGSIKQALSFSKDQLIDLHDCLFANIMMENNAEDNYVYIFNTMNALISQYRYKELEYIFPMLFYLQDKVENEEENNLTVQQRCCIHLIIVCLLVQIAKQYNSPELEAYINQILKLRKERNQLPIILEIDNDGKLSLNQSLSRTSSDIERHTPDNDTIVERNRVIDMLSKIEALKPKSGDLSEILNREYVEQQPFQSSQFQAESNIDVQSGITGNEWLDGGDDLNTNSIVESETVELTDHSILPTKHYMPGSEMLKHLTQGTTKKYATVNDMDKLLTQLETNTNKQMTTNASSEETKQPSAETIPSMFVLDLPL